MNESITNSMSCFSIFFFFNISFNICIRSLYCAFCNILNSIIKLLFISDKIYCFKGKLSHFLISNKCFKWIKYFLNYWKSSSRNGMTLFNIWRASWWISLLICCMNIWWRTRIILISCGWWSARIKYSI
jgi:hypothetical protein